MTIQRAWQRASAEQAHAIELPLVWYSDGRATLGHPRLGLRVITTAEPGGTFGYRAFLKLDVRSDDREVFVEEATKFLRSDTEEGRKLTEAESALTKAEEENEAWCIANVQGYEEFRNSVTALLETQGSAEDATEKNKIQYVLERSLNHLLNLRIRAGRKLPHPISERHDSSKEEGEKTIERLQWEIDQASEAFKAVVRGFMNNSEMVRQTISTFLENEELSLPSGKLFKRFVMGFGGESDASRTSALYSLEADDEITEIETDRYGNPVDTQEEEPIFVDIETVIKAVGNGKLISEHGSFAYFPGKQTTDVSTSFMQHVAEHVGNGLVGTVVDGICEWVVLPKSLLMQVLQSMAHYRKMGIIPAVMDATKQ